MRKAFSRSGITSRPPIQNSLGKGVLNNINVRPTHWLLQPPYITLNTRLLIFYFSKNRIPLDFRVILNYRLLLFCSPWIEKHRTKNKNKKIMNFISQNNINLFRRKDLAEKDTARKTLYYTRSRQKQHSKSMVHWDTNHSLKRCTLSPFQNSNTTYSKKYSPKKNWCSE